MIPDLLLVNWPGVIWVVLSIVVFVLSIALTLIILIQDSKDSGLTGAFGGTGGTALLGARMQKDLAKMTAIMGGVLALCLFVMGFLTKDERRQSIGEIGGSPPPAEGSATPGTTSGADATGVLPPANPVTGAPAGTPPPASSGTPAPKDAAVPPAAGAAPAVQTAAGAAPAVQPAAGAAPAVPGAPPPAGAPAGGTPPAPPAP
jgi:protein translocase SecG subunit